MEDILKYINNYYAITQEKGLHKITNGKITVRGKYLEGQYILVKGSILSDGVYRVETVEEEEITIHGAENEEFNGCVYGLAIPKVILELNKELEEIKKDYKPSLYKTESFANYSYTLADNGEGGNLTPISAISSRLNEYRCVYETSLSKSRRV